MLKGPFTPKTLLAERLRYFCCFSLVSDYVKVALSYLTSQNSCGYLESYFYSDEKGVLIFYVPLACISDKTANCSESLWDTSEGREDTLPAAHGWFSALGGTGLLVWERCFASEWVTFDRGVMMRKKIAFNLWQFLWNWILKKCFAVRVGRAALGFCFGFLWKTRKTKIKFSRKYSVICILGHQTLKFSRKLLPVFVQNRVRHGKGYDNRYNHAVRSIKTRLYNALLFVDYVSNYSKLKF